MKEILILVSEEEKDLFSVDRFYVPAISTFKLDKTELHGKWEKQSIGQVGSAKSGAASNRKKGILLQADFSKLSTEKIMCHIERGKERVVFSLSRRYIISTGRILRNLVIGG